MLLLSALGLFALAVSVATAIGASSPSVSFNPASYDYGPIGANTTAAHTFVLTNAGGKATGTIVVNVSGDTGATPYFTLTADACSGTKLPPKKSCSVTVRFAPTSSGSHYTAVLFAGDPKSFNASVPLAGGVSEGCGTLNDTTYFDGFAEGGSMGPFAFKAGETMTMAAADPNAGATGVTLAVNSSQVDAESYPGTVHYTIPNDGTFSADWRVAPAGAQATWTVTCTAPGSG